MSVNIGALSLLFNLHANLIFQAESSIINEHRGGGGGGGGSSNLHNFKNDKKTNELVEWLINTFQ